MPTYEYRCKTCKHQFEKFQSIADSPLTECPKCGSFVERLISGGGGLLFHGSGFYITDYRSESYKQAAKKESGSGSSSDTADSKTSGSGTAVSSSKDGS